MNVQNLQQKNEVKHVESEQVYNKQNYLCVKPKITLMNLIKVVRVVNLKLVFPD